MGPLLLLLMLWGPAKASSQRGKGTTTDDDDVPLGLLGHLGREEQRLPLAGHRGCLTEREEGPLLSVEQSEGGDFGRRGIASVCV